MARIVIAGTSEVSRTQLSRLLAASGYSVFRMCASEGQLRRAMTAGENGGGLISCLPPGGLAPAFGGRFQLLLIGRPETLSACESPRVFKLAYPCSGSAVIGAVEMLSQLHSMGLPRRQGEERALVEQAKRLLMDRYHIDEPTAHRRMQQYAMKHNLKMTDYARALLTAPDG